MTDKVYQFFHKEITTALYRKIFHRVEFDLRNHVSMKTDRRMDLDEYVSNSIDLVLNTTQKK